MTLSHQVTIWCDELDCFWFEERDGLARDARRELRLHGWGRVDGQDFCPVHAKQRGIKPARNRDAPGLALHGVPEQQSLTRK